MTTRPGWLVQRYDSLPSTMDRAALLARSGARERTAVVATEQTAGRGRGGRAWHSAPGHALACTLLLRPGVPASRLAALSLVAGVAVAEAIEALSSMPARLKWPNDVWLGNDGDNLKVAGILLASSLAGSGIAYVLIGVGVNVSTPREALPAGAASLLSASGQQTTPERLLDVVLQQLDRGYDDFLAAGGRTSLNDWRSRAALLGELVSVDDGGRVFTGILSGIDDDGALLLTQPDGAVQRVIAGDLTRGPRPAGQFDWSTSRGPTTP